MLENKEKELDHAFDEVNSDFDEDKANKEYSGDSIKVLKGLEAVRKRPGMYIGSTGYDGLHHMVWEILDNAIDEAMAGYCDQVHVTITKDGGVMVEDNGRGIPVDVIADTGKSGVETVLTVLHAGGKFDNEAYKVAGGLHGVGASCVNALSSLFKVWVVRNHTEYYMEFIDGGNPVEELKPIGQVDKAHGTKVCFYPDFTIMENFPWDENLIQNRLEVLAYLNKNIKLFFKSEMTGITREWHYPDGIKSYVLDLDLGKEAIDANIIYDEKEAKLKAPNNSGEEYAARLELAFRYNKTYNSSIHSFVNNINTTEGGTHEEGFRLALVKVINKYAFEKKLLKEGAEKISKEDVVEGLTAIISLKYANPLYEGQTKKKLGNSEIRPFVNEVTTAIFERFLNENPNEAVLIVKKAIAAQDARKRSQEAREASRRKSPLESGGLPGKLADCSMRDAEITELYIVEGDSAGGSAKTGREREYQAILPLKGKILNVEKAKSDRVFSSDEISYMISAIGTGVAPEFNIDKLRYGKIIIMTDADVDGSHIRILLLTFFFRYMPELLIKGHVYVAQPPLYKFSTGKNSKYAYTDAELEKFKAEVPSGRYTIQRYKGLGEMDPDQLWETTMQPSNRMLLQVTIDDASQADKAFSLFMGDDVGPRKDYIESHAKFVKNIDA